MNLGCVNCKKVIYEDDLMGLIFVHKKIDIIGPISVLIPDHPYSFCETCTKELAPYMPVVKNIAADL